MIRQSTPVLVLLFFVFFSISGCSEEKIEPGGLGRVTGKVVDQKTLEPVALANITTNPPSHVIFTDSVGTFILDSLAIGEYNLVVQKSAYKSGSLSISVKKDITTEVMLNLEKKPESLQIPVLTDLFYPLNESKDQGVDVNLGWQCTGDSVFYSLVVHETGNGLIHSKVSSMEDTLYYLEGLKFNTTYLWQVSAENKVGIVYSPIRTFTTRGFPENQLLYSKIIDGVSTIMIADTTRTSLIRLTRFNFHCWQPSINARKTKIALITNKAVLPQLHVMDVNGGSMLQLTSFSTVGFAKNGLDYAWTPDGNSIIYTRYNTLYQVNADGSNLKLIAVAPENKNFREVAVSPDGEKILAMVVGSAIFDKSIYMMDKNGGNQVKLFDAVDGIIENPIFSVDGKKILFTKDVSGFVSVDERQLDSRILELDIATLAVSDLSQFKAPGTNDTKPRYTPNGAAIVFMNGNNWAHAPSSIHIMMADGTQRKVLVEEASDPFWCW
jgi:TolB protein